MIKIEVTGASLGEVADKLMAIGRSLYNTAAYDADDAAREAMQAKRNAAKPEMVEAAPADPAPAAPAEPTTEATTAATGAATTSGTTTATAPADAVEPLSFEKDVAPVVLRAVATKGKPYVEGVMTEFGVVRASQLYSARWAELIERLEADA